MRILTLIAIIKRLQGLRLSGLEESEAQKRKGWINMYDMKTATGRARPLSIDSELFDHTNFNPHGLSAWQDPQTGWCSSQTCFDSGKSA